MHKNDYMRQQSVLFFHRLYKYCAATYSIKSLLGLILANVENYDD